MSAVLLQTYAVPTAYGLERHYKEKTMGRPVNKKYFGSGTGNQIKVRAKIGANAEGDGYIVSQRSTTKFKVTVGSDTGICKLVNKNTGTLSANELIVNFLSDDGVMVQATKLYNRTVVVEGNQRVKWNFTASQVDSANRAADVEGTNKLTIEVTTDPQDVTVDLSDSNTDTATFTVVINDGGVGDIRYQWQKQEGGAGAWANISGATSASYTTPVLTVADDNGDKFRVVVSSVSGAADSVTSDAATLTVQD